MLLSVKLGAHAGRLELRKNFLDARKLALQTALESPHRNPCFCKLALVRRAEARGFYEGSRRHRAVSSEKLLQRGRLLQICSTSACRHRGQGGEPHGAHRDRGNEASRLHGFLRVPEIDCGKDPSGCRCGQQPETG